MSDPPGRAAAVETTPADAPAQGATFRSESRAVLGLALPAIVTQVATVSMGFVDALMVARLGTEALAATTLGGIWIFGTMVPAMGVLFGLDPVVTQAHGARDGRRCGLALQRGLVLSAALAVPLAALWLLTGPVLRLAGQDAALAAVADAYVRVQAFSALPVLAFTALRQYLSGRAIMAPALWVSCLANLVNVGLNYVLIFGAFGIEGRGVLGAGLATALSRTFMFLALAAWVLAFRLHEGGWVAWGREALSRAGLADLLRHGIPTGAQIGLEVWGFQVMALLAGRLGAAALAAHAIVLQMACLTFMVPFGISIAAATRVGNLVGAGRRAAARTAAFAALGMGAAFMGLAGLAFILLREILPLAFAPTPEVFALAVAVLPVAAAFQVFDGTQAVGCGVLRGLGDTKPAAIYNLVGYYCLGVPLGALLAFRAGAGLPGLWWGLALGLATVAGLLVLRIHRRT